jgi:hypothetical protein
MLFRSRNWLNLNARIGVIFHLSHRTQDNIPARKIGIQVARKAIRKPETYLAKH